MNVVWFDGGAVRDSTDYTAVGFLVGPDAAHIAQMGERVIVSKMIQQLDDMFGTEQDPHPGTSTQMEIYATYMHAYTFTPFDPVPRSVNPFTSAM